MGLWQWNSRNTAGVLSLANTPVAAVWVLGVLLGIELICEGAALGRLAWQARNT
jgi:uncharacterized membrane protein HdeD (DUF308 family)